MAERSIAWVPVWVRGLVVAAVALQGAIALHRGAPQARAEDLPPPPTAQDFRLASFGDQLPTAQASMMWLQAFDNQPGVSIPFRTLDFQRVTEWLHLILVADPRAQYPLLAASRVYGSVSEPTRQRLMLEWVAQEFEADPMNRWQWMGHAVIAAMHELKDQELALRYAQRLRHYGEDHPKIVPAWARQIEIVVLEKMGREDAAKILIGGLLESGKVTDETELRFLSERMAEPSKP